MKVILLADVKKLGKKGDVLEVAEGYGRNFLIPRGLAAEASQGKLRELAEMQKIEERKKAQQAQEAQEIAQKIKEVEVKVAVKVGEGGKLFGAISNKDISEQLKKQHNIKVDRKKIELKSPIKSLGAYNINVKLHPKVQTELKVMVVEE